MKKFIVLSVLLISFHLSFSQTNIEFLKRATAKEIGNTRTDDVTVSNVNHKPGGTVTWYASANGNCYECDADGFVQSVHIVKIECGKVPTASTNSPTPVNDECLHYKKMKNVGVGLSIGGGVSFVIGMILIPVGGQSANTGAVGAGAAFTLLGIGGLSAGIPIAIVNGRKFRNYCSKTSFISLTTGNGLGLALNF